MPRTTLDSQLTSRLVDLAGAGSRVLSVRDADVGAAREHWRRGRLLGAAALAAVALALAWLRARTVPVGGGFLPLPAVDPVVPVVLLTVALLGALAVGRQVLAGRSPHVTYRAEQIDVGLADVVGIDAVKDEVVQSLNLLLAHRTFRRGMGGTPRRGLLFEGAPGTGKTHLARALAKEAGVPFLFVSATGFSGAWPGAGPRKVRSYFRALRRAARREGGAIGFVEEIDAVAGTRGSPPQAVGSGPPGSGAVVHELLVQMQSFDAPPTWQRVLGWCADRVDLLLPGGRRLRRPAARPANVLLVAATNRAQSLDPALLRPGRFDRRLHFEPPGTAGRRALIDHFLAGKAHEPELDVKQRREALAVLTAGYSPAALEQLFDEALVNALRGGRCAMTWQDVEAARLVADVGAGTPVDYTDHERTLIATHEAGHATAAWLVAPHRRLEVLTIIRRRGALGLLAHSDREQVYTRSRSELSALIQIALAGQCAEQIFLGDVSTGPGGDLLQATSCAAEMVGVHGMAGTLLSYAALAPTQPDDTGVVGRVLADQRGRDRVEALLQEQQRIVLALLQTHRDLVEALRDALLDREELVGSEITDILERARATPRTLDLTGGPRVAV